MTVLSSGFAMTSALGIRLAIRLSPYSRQPESSVASFFCVGEAYLSHLTAWQLHPVKKLKSARPKLRGEPTMPKPPPQTSDRAFDFLRINQRGSKPRLRGVTEIRGPYY